MAFSIVTGRGESDHVTSDDMGRFQAATLGSQRCVIDGLEVSLIDNNTVHVSGGMLYIDGRYFRCTDEGEYLTISNGAQDRNRIDCIVLRYRMDEFGVDYYEYGELAVLQGDFAAGDPLCPSCAGGSILDNDKLVEVPLWTIPITGLSVGDPSELLIKRGYSLPVALGGTGSDNADEALENLGAAKAKHNHSADNITSGTLPKERGGTGLSASPSMLVNLGVNTAANVLQASPRPGVTGTLPVANGGTGASDAAGVRANLGVAAASHNHSATNITSGTLPVARGGSGLTASPSMLVNLGSSTAANVMQASPRPGITGTLAIAHGGTGATTAANARSNLGIKPGYIVAGHNANQALANSMKMVTLGTTVDVSGSNMFQLTSNTVKVLQSGIYLVYGQAAVMDCGADASVQLNIIGSKVCAVSVHVWGFDTISAASVMKINANQTVYMEIGNWSGNVGSSPANPELSYLVVAKIGEV